MVKIIRLATFVIAWLPLLFHVNAYGGSEILLKTSGLIIATVLVAASLHARYSDWFVMALTHEDYKHV